MNGKDLLESMGYVDEKFIEEAESVQLRRTAGIPWTRVAGMAACLGLVLFGVAAFGRWFGPAAESLTNTENAPEMSLGDGRYDYYYGDTAADSAHSITADKVELAPDMESPLVTPECDCVRAQYFRTGSPAAAAEAEAVVLRSRAELENYCAALAGNSSTAAFLEAMDAYDDGYFAQNQLIVLRLDETSGSVRHKVTGVQKDENGQWTVTVQKQIPEMGTCDMARWHILVEVQMGKITGSEETVAVQFVK